MKFRPLVPWIKGNESVTPRKFYCNFKPCFEMGALFSLDIAVDLYLANTVDMGNLYDSWNKNKKYIERVCEIAYVNGENKYDLDHEEKGWILKELGEPPQCCYNLYFVSVYNETEEKLVYVGKTDSKKSSFANGHLEALKLHDPKYNEYCKRVYFGTIMFLSKEKEYVPLEFIEPFSEAERYLSEMEAFLIAWFNPELNIKSEKIGEMRDLGVVHIQNFSEKLTFLNDYMVYGNKY